jgi:hypothetical protein
MSSKEWVSQVSMKISALNTLLTPFVCECIFDIHVDLVCRSNAFTGESHLLFVLLGIFDKPI